MPAAPAIATYAASVFLGSATARITVIKSLCSPRSAGELGVAFAVLSAWMAALRSFFKGGGQFIGDTTRGFFGPLNLRNLVATPRHD